MELPEEDLTWAVTEGQTAVQKLHQCFPLHIFSLPCPEAAHGRYEQAPNILNLSRGTFHWLKSSLQEEVGGGWSLLSSVGQGELWLPARASEHLPLQCDLSVLLLPVSSAGEDVSPKARRCRTTAGAAQDGDALVNMPALSLGLMRNKLWQILKCCWKIPVEDPCPLQSRKNRAG